MERFRILNSAGRVCCSADRLDLLCDSCRAKAHTGTGVPEPMSLATALGTKPSTLEPAFESFHGVDAPPSIASVLAEQTARGLR